jgi:hypothetical protein
LNNGYACRSLMIQLTHDVWQKCEGTATARMAAAADVADVARNFQREIVRRSCSTLMLCAQVFASGFADPVVEQLLQVSQPSEQDDDDAAGAVCSLSASAEKPARRAAFAAVERAHARSALGA